MNLPIAEAVNRLQADSKYPGLFQNAFGTDEITPSQIGKALAQFERKLISANSKFDAWIRNEVELTTDGLFWDGGAKDLESLNFGPLTHPDEMAGDLDDLVSYLENDEAYQALFELVFDEDQIQSAYISRVISQYVRTLISQNSKYDQWKRNQTLMNELELKGYHLYQQNCSSCHQESLFTDRDFHINGLDKEYPNPPELESLY